MKKTEQQLEQQAITLGFSIIAILLIGGWSLFDYGYNYRDIKCIEERNCPHYP